MEFSACQRCGSSDLAASNFGRSDFPSSLIIVECSSCNAMVGLTTLANLIDLSRRRGITGKAFAKAFFDGLPVKQTLKITPANTDRTGVQGQGIVSEN